MDKPEWTCCSFSSAWHALSADSPLLLWGACLGMGTGMQDMLRIVARPLESGKSGEDEDEDGIFDSDEEEEMGGDAGGGVLSSALPFRPAAGVHALGCCWLAGPAERCCIGRLGGRRWGSVVKRCFLCR